MIDEGNVKSLLDINRELRSAVADILLVDEQIET